MVRIKVELPEIVEVSKYIVLLEKLINEFEIMEKGEVTKFKKLKVAEKGEISVVEHVKEVSEETVSKAKLIDKIMKNKKMNIKEIKNMNDTLKEGLDIIVGNHLNNTDKQNKENKEKDKEKRREEKKEKKEEKEKEKAKKKASLKEDNQKSATDHSPKVTTAEVVSELVNESEINKKI